MDIIGTSTFFLFQAIDSGGQTLYTAYIYGLTTIPQETMKIQPISHKSLAQTTAGKLVASILDGSLPSGTQLPPERELMSKLGISRSTLREALKSL